MATIPGRPQITVKRLWNEVTHLSPFLLGFAGVWWTYNKLSGVPTAVETGLYFLQLVCFFFGLDLLTRPVVIFLDFGKEQIVPAYEHRFERVEHDHNLAPLRVSFRNDPQVIIGLQHLSLYVPYADRHLLSSSAVKRGTVDDAHGGGKSFH